MEKIIIVGAGISGLTAGIYARLSGFDAEIYEMHSIAGGECTAWKRGGYVFDNCIYWLMGSKEGTGLNRVWREVGALDDSVEIINADVFSSLEMGGRTATIYRKIDKLEKHFLELSPQDGDLIREFCADARKFKRLAMPVDKPVDMMGPLQGMRLGMKMVPLIGLLKKYGSITLPQFAARFKDPLLRTLISRMLPAPYSAMPLLMTLGSLDNMDGGFPEGGSLPFAQRMEKRYASLGGKIFYNSPVEKILVENGTAVGIRLADGTERRADWVVSAADGYHTLFNMLEGKYLNDKIKVMYENDQDYPIYTTVQVSMGINADLSARSAMLAVPTDKPVDAGGISHDFVPLKNYCFDGTMAPRGKSVVTCVLDADFDWWKAKKQDAEAYRAEKERVGREVCAVLESRYPEAKGKIEQVDVATPMTYVRYCNAWRGAWMSFMSTPKSAGGSNDMTGALPGLSRFLLSGQWIMPPGGLPGAVLSGKWAVQRICADSKVKFNTHALRNSSASAKA